MQRTLNFLVLIGWLLAGVWPGKALAITLSPGFSTVTRVSGLTAPRGVAESPPLDNFPCCRFIVEPSLNRVARSDGAPPWRLPWG